MNVHSVAHRQFKFLITTRREEESTLNFARIPIQNCLQKSETLPICRHRNYVSSMFGFVNILGTYRSRNRRATLAGDFARVAIDVVQAEKQILQEFGPKVCVLEEPCKFHAFRPAVRGQQPDWDDILR